MEEIQFLRAYDGCENFVCEMIEYHQNNKEFKSYVAYKSNC